VRPQSSDDKSHKKEEEEEEVRMGSVWLMDAGRTERGWSNVDTTLILFAAATATMRRKLVRLQQLCGLCSRLPVTET